MDILVNNMDAPPTLLRNDGGNRHHWIGFRGAPVGARVTIWAGGRRQMAEVKSASSYLSSNDPRLHFGLGPATLIERVVVRFPSGEERERRGLTADRYWEVP